MPAQIWKILPNESGLQPGLRPPAARLAALPLDLPSLDAAAAELPQGAYTSFRTYQHGSALRLDEHFDRLEETSQLAGKTVRLDRQGLRAALRAILAEYPPDQELRLRVLIDLVERPGETYLAAEPLAIPPPQAYAAGVKTWARPFTRPNPAAKLTGIISAAKDLRSALPTDVNEILIFNGAGEILEGLSSNFFAVRDGQLWTAGAGMLSGITRALVLEEAAAAGLPVRLNPVRLSELSELHEAFITSVSRAVLPVRQVEEQPIGPGWPGPLTRLLAERFQARLAREIQPI